MTYEGRTIWARGLTNYMRGYTLRFSDFDGLYHEVIVANVSYDEVAKQTIVQDRDGEFHELAHQQQVVIHG